VFFRWCVEEERIDESPMKRVRCALRQAVPMTDQSELDLRGPDRRPDGSEEGINENTLIRISSPANARRVQG
jgi:hypothetical protein